MTYTKDCTSDPSKVAWYEKRKHGHIEDAPLIEFMYLVNGDVAQLVDRRTGTPLMQVGFPGAARDFSPRVNFQCRLSYGVCNPRVQSHALIRTHVKDPVVYIRVRWITETLKHPAYTVGWVA